MPCGTPREQDTLPGPLVPLFPQRGTNREGFVKRGSRGVPPAHGGSGHRDSRAGRGFGGEMGGSPPRRLPCAPPARGSPGGTRRGSGAPLTQRLQQLLEVFRALHLPVPGEVGHRGCRRGGRREGTEGGISGSRDPPLPPHRHRPRRWLPPSVRPVPPAPPFYRRAGPTPRPRPRHGGSALTCGGRAQREPPRPDLPRGVQAGGTT